MALRPASVRYRAIGEYPSPWRRCLRMKFAKKILAGMAGTALMSVLMGLVFLSSGTGHDNAITDPLENKD